MKAIAAMLRLILWVAVLATPVLGVWLASSMAAMLNGPRWLAVLGGALLFPLGPLLWDAAASGMRARSERRRRAKSSFLQDLDARRRARLTFGDRLFLRTLALNAAFLGGLLWQVPETAVTALTSRGDWPLDGVEAGWTDGVRAGLLALADRAERAVEVAPENPYADLGDEPAPPPPPPTPASEVTAPAGAATEATVQLVVPTDARVQVTSVVPPVVSEGPGPLTLPLEDATLLLSWADGRLLQCSMSVVEGAVRIFELGEGEASSLDGRPCTELQPPDPAWRPAIRLVRGAFPNLAADSRDDAAITEELLARGALRPGEVARWDGGRPRSLQALGEAVVSPDQVERVLSRPPFLRIVLTKDGSDALCEATTRDHQQLALEVDGALRHMVLPFEPVCGGVLAVPLDDSLSQASQQEMATAVGEITGGKGDLWELRDTPLPEVAALPVEVEGSIASVGRALQERFPSETDRARAVHDYIATRVAYDVVSLQPGKRAPQDADTVFRTRLGVCAGYANLFVALARAAGLEAVYLVGKSRDEEGGLSGSGHAWNAVRLDGAWHLVDVTWDAGGLGEKGFEADFDTAYLFTPPEIFRVTHLPEEDGWQLATPAMGRGEFTRVPMLRPSFFAAGLALLSPARSQVDTVDEVKLTVRNPRGQHLIVEVQAEGAPQRCAVTGREELVATCRFPAPGRYELRLFHNDEPYGDYGFGGRLLVNVSR